MLKTAIDLRPLGTLSFLGSHIIVSTASSPKPLNHEVLMQMVEFPLHFAVPPMEFFPPLFYGSSFLPFLCGCGIQASTIERRRGSMYVLANCHSNTNLNAVGRLIMASGVAQSFTLPVSSKPTD